MGDWWTNVMNVMSSDRVFILLRALVIASIGFVVARAASSAVLKVMGKFLDAQQRMIVSRAVYYLLLGLFLLSALHELGFSLSILVGAAGVLSVAVGFASQTSASNLISGLFLIVERPFSVGDVITLGGTTGEVLSIDLLSVKLRTFDNLYVRIPNETLIKSEVTTLTKFPIRRIDLQLGVAYKEDIAKVRELLFQLAEKNPLSLEEPKPLFIFLGFGDSAINLQFSIWVKRENFLDLKNAIQEEIKTAFEHEGIEIPFPQRTLVAGDDQPFAVRVVEGREKSLD
jgi:small-conductance mechanosensitive channel